MDPAASSKVELSILSRGGIQAYTADKNWMRAFMQSTVPSGILDERYNALLCNPSWARAFSAQTEAGRRYQDFWHPDDFARELKEIANIHQWRTTSYTMIKRLLSMDGVATKVIFTIVLIQMDPLLLHASFIPSDVNDTSDIKALGHVPEHEDLTRIAAFISHDLQQLLRMISAYQSLVSARAAARLDESDRKHLAIASDHTHRIQQLFSELTAYLRVASAPSAEGITDCNLILQEVISVHQNLINESGARIDSQNLPTVAMNAFDVRVIIDHLVRNALQYRSATAPLIRIKAERVGLLWRIDITDNGIGIPSEHQEKVFRLFHRLHTHEQSPGSGVGLAMAKRVIERRGGWIKVASNSGAGVTFTFTLPACT